MKTKLLYLWGILIGVFLCLSTALADGVVIVDPDNQTDINVKHILSRPQPLTVKYHRVSISIDDRVAKTTIDQVFKNSYDLDLEGTYMFPLPEDAAISDFALYMNGRKISGEILDRDEARKIYEDIVTRMKDPGLLEYVGRNMFKASIYPIPAHGETKIELEYIQTIEYDDGFYRYVYPLNTERFSPLPLKEVTITADVRSSVPLKNIYSPSHRVDVSMDMYEARVGYESYDVKPDRDFVLYYSVSREDIGMGLLSYKKHGEDGYFAMLLSPGDLEAEASPKDIVFVLDTSGSMNGRKLIQAKEALRFCISNLKRQDRFNIIGFSTGVNSLSGSLIPVNEENINRALRFVERFGARGGTNINEALLTGLELFRDSVNPGMVIFLTEMPGWNGHATLNLLETYLTQVHFSSLVLCAISSIFSIARGDGLKLPFSQRLTVRTLTPSFRANPSWLKPSSRLSSLIASLSIVKRLLL